LLTHSADHEVSHPPTGVQGSGNLNPIILGYMVYVQSIKTKKSLLALFAHGITHHSRLFLLKVQKLSPDLLESALEEWFKTVRCILSSVFGHCRPILLCQTIYIVSQKTSPFYILNNSTKMNRFQYVLVYKNPE